MRAYHTTRDGVTYCTKHDEHFADDADCPECLAEDGAEKIKPKAYCETHDEIFETECPSCAMWKANTLDQDVQETVAAPSALSEYLAQVDSVQRGIKARIDDAGNYLHPTKQAADGWVDWNGGECPVATGVEILYKLRALGGVRYYEDGARLSWEHTGEGGDIVAYKVLNAPQTAPSEPQSGGVKFDQGKPPVSLVDRHAIEQIANVLAFGAKKYAAHNWRQGINYSRLLDAALRHLFAFADGEDNDPESGLSHIAHAGCCVVFLLGMINTRPELDDRFKATK